MTLCKDGFEEENENESIPPGTLPDDIEISKGAEDLLRRLLQIDPRVRLKSIFLLQRIAFFMGHDVQSYTSKKVCKKTKFVIFKLKINKNYIFNLT